LVGTLGNTSQEAVATVLYEQGRGTGARYWKGIFPDEIEVAQIPPLALVHVDVDLWASATAALAIFGERLVLGGILIMDDYGTDECPGVIEAVEDWAVAQGDRFTIERTAYPTYQAIITRAAK